MIPPRTGEITQDAAIVPTTPQSAMPQPPAATPAPRTPPTMECVVETGAPTAVAKFSHKAAASSPAIMIQMNVPVSPICAGSMIPLLIVPTTSPPAISAPDASNTAAMMIAPVRVIACDPTAGPTLLATSLAPMFSAM